MMGACYVRKDCLIVHLPGELDHFQAEELRKECDLMCMRHLIRDIIFDFSATVFMDSSGIGLILGRLQLMQQMDGRVYLFGGSPMIRKMWDMAGIMSYVTLLTTVEEMKEVYE